MAKQQEPKPENVKDYIVVVTFGEYDAPTEVYTFHGTYRRACKKAIAKYFEQYPRYVGYWDHQKNVSAIAREAQFSGEEAWHFDRDTLPYEQKKSS